MKKLRLLSLVGITSIALAQAGWAGHGGGGGGFSGGGHGGGGGHFGGGGGGFGGAPHFGGGARGAPRASFGGAANRGGGVGWAMPPRSSAAVPRFATTARQVQSFRPSRTSVQQRSGGNPTRGLANIGRGNRTVNNQGRAKIALNRSNSVGSPNARGQASRSAAPRPSNEAAFSRQNHIFARQDSARHQDWDRRHAHFSNGHWWCWDGGYWIGLDAGFYPWDFYPYYASDYYPYDYYTDVEPVDQGYAAQQPDPNVSAVQTELAQLGYYNGPNDGLFGADTRTALTRYQIDHGLQVTGSLTTDTLQSLGLPPATSS